MENEARSDFQMTTVGDVPADTFNWMASRYLKQTQRVTWNGYSRWIHQTARLIADWHPDSVVDLGCGPGYLLSRLQSMLPDARLVGVDYASEMLAQVPPSVPAKLATMADWSTSGHERFDVGVLSFSLRDQGDVAATLTRLYDRLRPGGHLVLLETHTPAGWRKWGFEAYVHHALPWWAERVGTRDWAGQPDESPYRWLSRSHRLWDQSLPTFPQLLYRLGYRDLTVHTQASDVVLLWSATVVNLPHEAGLGGG
ncbi:MAG: class I SAM-dependent methyltransferase [Firmicutes bacterium]|jgi:ubiquinone/menaquinone biosynthesis C-methylase UbiE|nr:class I SAM-dependent methyltransferase [Bacillota bacterium]MCL5065879.1 class I SAM-dependent methyltransferase [Bacillota bacterium]